MRLLRTLVAVVDCGSVVAASRERGYSSAAISRQISELQRRLGVRLIEPQGRSIRASSAGLAVAEQARQLIAEADRFEAFTRSLATGRRTAGGKDAAPGGTRTVARPFVAEAHA